MKVIMARGVVNMATPGTNFTVGEVVTFETYSTKTLGIVIAIIKVSMLIAIRFGRIQ